MYTFLLILLIVVSLVLIVAILLQSGTGPVSYTHLTLPTIYSV